MYFFDGHNLFRDSDATYGKCWGLEAFLDGWQKKMIVVGMECGHEGRERLDEYCPYDVRGGSLGEIHGMGGKTMEWIVHEVKPWVDNAFRTYSFREATGIAGSSMGGLMSIYAAAKYNATFSKAACLSSAIRLCRKQLLSEIGAIDPDTRVYLSWGTDGGQNEPHGHCQPGNRRGFLEKARHGHGVLPGGRPPLRSRLGKTGAPVHGVPVVLSQRRPVGERIKPFNERREKETS